MSDTPRTDAAILIIECDDSCCDVWVKTVGHADTYTGEVCRADKMAELERELSEKTDAVQDAADMIDDWRNRTRREKDSAISWEEKHNAVKRELADAEEAVLSLNAQLAEAKEAEASEARWAAQYKQQRDKAKEREEKLKTMLLDPTTVHINMMRGTIAKLDWPTLEHIHGNHPLRAQRDALLEALEELHAAMVRYDGDVDGEAPSEHHQMMSRVRSAIALAKGGGQ